MTDLNDARDERGGLLDDFFKRILAIDFNGVLGDGGNVFVVIKLTDEDAGGEGESGQDLRRGITEVEGADFVRRSGKREGIGGGVFRGVILGGIIGDDGGRRDKPGIDDVVSEVIITIDLGDEDGGDLTAGNVDFVKITVSHGEKIRSGIIENFNLGEVRGEFASKINTVLGAADVQENPLDVIGRFRLDEKMVIVAVPLGSEDFAGGSREDGRKVDFLHLDSLTI